MWPVITSLYSTVVEHVYHTESPFVHLYGKQIIFASSRQSLLLVIEISRSWVLLFGKVGLFLVVIIHQVEPFMGSCVIDYSLLLLYNIFASVATLDCP
jgi:hypothetical protein